MGLRILDVNTLLRVAAHKAEETMAKGDGGPFGAIIVDEDGNILSIASNSVLKDNDPTAHAEINAIREACKIKGSHDLKGCYIICTGYPCPMCLSAIMWANIEGIYVSGHPVDAEKIGFRDNHMYEYIRNLNGLLPTTEGPTVYLRNRQIAQDLYSKYAAQDKEIY